MGQVLRKQKHKKAEKPAWFERGYEKNGVKGFYESSIWSYIPGLLEEYVAKEEAKFSETDTVKLSQNHLVPSYGGANWNALPLRNFIFQVFNRNIFSKTTSNVYQNIPQNGGLNSVIDENLLKNVVLALKNKKKYSAYHDKIDDALKDVKIYAQDLQLYDYLSRMRKIVWSEKYEKLLNCEVSGNTTSVAQAVKEMDDRLAGAKHSRDDLEMGIVGIWQVQVAPNISASFYVDKGTNKLCGFLQFPTQKSTKNGDWFLRKYVFHGKVFQDKSAQGSAPYEYILLRHKDNSFEFEKLVSVNDLMNVSKNAGIQNMGKIFDVSVLLQNFYSDFIKNKDVYIENLKKQIRYCKRLLPTFKNFKSAVDGLSPTTLRSMNSEQKPPLGLEMTQKKYCEEPDVEKGHCHCTDKLLSFTVVSEDDARIIREQILPEEIEEQNELASKGEDDAGEHNFLAANLERGVEHFLSTHAYVIKDNPYEIKLYKDGKNELIRAGVNPYYNKIFVYIPTLNDTGKTVERYISENAKLALDKYYEKVQENVKAFVEDLSELPTMTGRLRKLIEQAKKLLPKTLENVDLSYSLQGKDTLEAKWEALKAPYDRIKNAFPYDDGEKIVDSKFDVMLFKQVDEKIKKASSKKLFFNITAMKEFSSSMREPELCYDNDE